MLSSLLLLVSDYYAMCIPFYTRRNISVGSRSRKLLSFIYIEPCIIRTRVYIIVATVFLRKIALMLISRLRLLWTLIISLLRNNTGRITSRMLTRSSTIVTGSNYIVINLLLICLLLLIGLLLTSLIGIISLLINSLFELLV